MYNKRTHAVRKLKLSIFFDNLFLFLNTPRKLVSCIPALIPRTTRNTRTFWLRGYKAVAHAQTIFPPVQNTSLTYIIVEVESISDPLKHLIPSLFCIMRTNLAGNLPNRTKMAEGDGICYADSLENTLGIVPD